MKTLHVVFAAVFAVFVFWLFMKFKENFTTNFNPGENLEKDIHGYSYVFGDKRSDLATYFGFEDSIRSGFAHRLLPDIIPQDAPKK